MTWPNETAQQSEALAHAIDPSAEIPDGGVSELQVEPPFVVAMIAAWFEESSPTPKHAVVVGHDIATSFEIPLGRLSALHVGVVANGFVLAYTNGVADAVGVEGANVPAARHEAEEVLPEHATLSA
jgi:hypothetical protein